VSEHWIYSGWDGGNLGYGIPLLGILTKAITELRIDYQGIATPSSVWRNRIASTERPCDMYYLYIVAGLALVVSLIANREKTFRAVRIAARRFINILPAFLIMLVLVSVVLFLVSDKLIAKYLGSSNAYIAVLWASILGSVTLMPGFIAFPLAGILLAKGVLYMVLSAFTTSLMMVGVLTYPLEKEYFGMKVTVLRNAISFFIALAVALMTGIFFREIL